jgi:hypothetical protein
MIVRFGIGVAIVLGWFTVWIYSDLQRQNNRILEAFQQQTTTNGEHVHAIRELAKGIEEAHEGLTPGSDDSMAKSRSGERSRPALNSS